MAGLIILIYFSSQGNSGNSSQHSEASKNSNVEGDEDWSGASQMRMRIVSFRDKSIDKWQRKTQVTTGAAAIKGKLQAFNQNISKRVAAYVRDPSRMVNRRHIWECKIIFFIHLTVKEIMHIYTHMNTWTKLDKVFIICYPF
ncbi:uncharacterized protein LOC132188117 [Corylus avellana]|uniref:uncharacterized protein LOC132188117 n=1 Tax=Corylus avellana TaxID=13451 RepID=UPI00286A95A5|nr:uncharacterized protein LOC132188117 [Corylus avellana]